MIHGPVPYYSFYQRILFAATCNWKRQNYAKFMAFGIHGMSCDFMMHFLLCYDSPQPTGGRGSCQGLPIGQAIQLVNSWGDGCSLVGVGLMTRILFRSLALINREGRTNGFLLFGKMYKRILSRKHKRREICDKV